MFFNREVSKEYKEIKVRWLLRHLLAEYGMKYYLDGGIIVMTMDKAADKKLIVRDYPVSNLVGGEALVKAAIAELQRQRDLVPPPQPRMPFGPGLPLANEPQQLQLGPTGELLSRNIDGLTNRIKNSVDPDHWQGPANGPGSMTFIPAGATLQVRCSLEVHHLLVQSGLLDNAKQEPTPKELKTMSVRSYSVAGILNTKNVEGSKADLLAALKLIGVKEGGKAGTSILILADSQLLVARQPLETHLEIERLLMEMRAMSSLKN